MCGVLPDDIMKLTVRNNKGHMVPLSELATPRWVAVYYDILFGRDVVEFFFDL